MNSVKNNIAQNFSNAALNYNQYSSVQKEVAAELFLNFKDKIKADSKILDLGCGTGYLAKYINSQIKNLPPITQIDLSEAMIKEASKVRNTESLIADMEELPFQQEKFDIVISSLAIQWGNLEKILTEIKKVLTPGGVVALTSLSDNSFKNIKSEFPEIFFEPMLSFADAQNICSKVFPDIFLKQITINQEYNSLIDFIKSLKEIGATQKNKQKTKFLGKDFFNASKNSIETNWEIILINLD